MTTAYRKKLIEVALPLPEINEGSKPETENPFLKGHPRSIHNWWARTPLSVCRAVLFAQLVDDPGSDLPPEQASEARRELLELVQALGTWEAATDHKLLARAKEIIRSQFKGDVPEFWDMFSGRGSLPLEAQRLGLKVTASDLNPVAVLIGKCLMDFPVRFADRPPLNPEQHMSRSSTWRGAAGLACDIAYYGRWVAEQARARLAPYYPKAPGGAPVIAWLWARTVPSPDPAQREAPVPLVTTFLLSKPKGKDDLAWVEPVIDREKRTIQFRVRTGRLDAETLKRVAAGTKLKRGCNFTCLLSGQPISEDHVKKAGMAGKLGTRLMAIVAASRGRPVYLDPIAAHVDTATSVSVPEALGPITTDIALDKRAIWCILYGLTSFDRLFTPRQLTSLSTFLTIIQDVRDRVAHDARESEMGRNDGRSLAQGGHGVSAYAEAVTAYLVCALSRLTDYSCSLATWNPTNENVRNLFQRQGIPMAWDFAEANVIEGKLCFSAAADWVASALTTLPAGNTPANVLQIDARRETPSFAGSPVVSTDPPYYDNIGYADLSDFFYVWLRAGLRHLLPELFRTVTTPKEAELIASPYRHGGSSDAAEKHFREGFAAFCDQLKVTATADVPITLYYAFKQEEEDTESDGNHRVSTGWDTMLEGLVDAGFQITGTWPVRTTKKARSVARGTNALASAVVLVARRRSPNAPQCSRREFLVELKKELPVALKHLQAGNIAPVDLAQAAIGPGMAVYSRYSRILETDGSSMTVRTALTLINQSLDETLAEQEGDFDPETAWAVAWFEQFGFGEGPFGDAETLSRAKNTAINALTTAGIVKASAGKTRLFGVDELPSDWDPATDLRLTVWEMVHHLIRVMNVGGETAAAILAAKLGAAADTARELAYRLYSICERRKRATEALAYNALVQSWPEICRLAREHGKPRETQRQMFERE